MHFGRVETPVDLNEPLPPEAPRTTALLEIDWKGRREIYAGCPIWNAPTWVGGLYPLGTKADRYLIEYSQRLTAVEVNGTFYHQIGPGQIKAWADKVPPGFKFCPKVFRGISEKPGGSALAAEIRATAEGFAAFGEAYGLGFMTMPETFSARDVDLLKRVLAAWPKSLPLAVEVRHPSWFQEHRLLDDAINLLYRAGAATVITDTPGRRDVLHQSLSQPRVMVRLQGQEGHASDGARADAWAERLSSWSERGLDQVFFFAHQPEEPLIPDTVNWFLKGLQRRGRLEPAPWLLATPRIRSLFDGSEHNRPEIKPV